MRALWHLVWHQFTTCFETHVYCTKCNGRGSVEEKPEGLLIRVNSWYVTCGSCGGKGRLCPKFEQAAIEALP